MYSQLSGKGSSLVSDTDLFKKYENSRAIYPLSRTNNKVAALLLHYHMSTKYHESHSLQAIMKRQFTSSASMASTALPTSPMGQWYNSTIQLNYSVSKHCFPAWGLTLFDLFGIAAIGVVFCVFLNVGEIGTTEESIRGVAYGLSGTFQHGGHAMKDHAMEEP